MPESLTTASSVRTEAGEPIATGWLLWLTWFFAIALGSGVVGALVALFLGPDYLARLLGIPFLAPNVTVWWGVHQAAYLFFGVACVGVLMRDRDFARYAVILAWSIVALQCADAALQIFRLRLSIPIGAILYAAYAVKMGRVLRGRPPVMPPRSGGML